jgi:pyruvate kinase
MPDPTPTVPHRGTKVVATAGPATDGRIEAMIRAGVDVFRVNFSHGTRDDHVRRVQEIRSAAERLTRHIAVMGDLQGPKIRIHRFRDGEVTLEAGAMFRIDTTLAPDAGTVERVGTGYPSLPHDVGPGDALVLGDGLVELDVTGTTSTEVICRVVTGGRLAGGQGINKRHGGLSAGAITSQDERDIGLAAELELDYLAVSFPRAADDIVRARSLADAAGLRCGIIAKIERAEVVADTERLDEVILAADAVMVARGDLGIEIGDAALMGVQKLVIHRARELNREAITATQMMESMINNPIPTRAEVMDVANAVLDGTDAVMLSGETAIGRYPVETVAAMVRVIRGAESSAEFLQGERPQVRCRQIDESIALAAMTVANQLEGVRAVACVTTSGTTPRLMSRFRSRLPIYAMSSVRRTLARVELYHSVQPVYFEGSAERESITDQAIDWLKAQSVVAAGDRVILSRGDRRNLPGGTNTLRVIDVR